MYFSYSNNNKNYTKAVSLQNVRSINIDKDKNIRSEFRYVVNIRYTDSDYESFEYLYEEEAETLYKQIVEELNLI